MLCYSSENQLTIKVADLPSYRQFMQGIVVGFLNYLLLNLMLLRNERK
jgi:hypothetical protein